MHLRLTVRQPAGHAGVGGVLVNIAFVWLLLVKYRCLSSVLATSPPKFPHDLEKIRTVKLLPRVTVRILAVIPHILTLEN